MSVISNETSNIKQVTKEKLEAEDEAIAHQASRMARTNRDRKP